MVNDLIYPDLRLHLSLSVALSKLPAPAGCAPPPGFAACVVDAGLPGPPNLRVLRLVTPMPCAACLEWLNAGAALLRLGAVGYCAQCGAALGDSPHWVSDRAGPTLHLCYACARRAGYLP